MLTEGAGQWYNCCIVIVLLMKDLLLKNGLEVIL